MEPGPRRSQTLSSFGDIANRELPDLPPEAYRSKISRIWSTFKKKLSLRQNQQSNMKRSHSVHIDRGRSMYSDFRIYLTCQQCYVTLLNPSAGIIWHCHFNLRNLYSCCNGYSIILGIEQSSDLNSTSSLIRLSRKLCSY